jgi:hypothetical protein
MRNSAAEASFGDRGFERGVVGEEDEMGELL